MGVPTAIIRFVIEDEEGGKTLPFRFEHPRNFTKIVAYLAREHVRENGTKKDEIELVVIKWKVEVLCTDAASQIVATARDVGEMKVKIRNGFISLPAPVDCGVRDVDPMILSTIR